MSSTPCRRPWLSLVLPLLLGTAHAAWPQAVSGSLIYTALQPCRLVDTRLAGGPLQPGAQGARTFNVVGVAAAGSLAAQGGDPNGCPVPGFADVPQVQAVLINVVAVAPSGPGDLRAWPTDHTAPSASIINYSPNVTVANAVVLPVRQDHQANDVTVQADVSATSLVVDILGYFSELTPTTVSGADSLFLGAFSNNPGGVTGANNTGIGVFGLRALTSGSANTALGSSALLSNSTGSFNTAIGPFTLQGNTSGGTNTAVGAYSMSATTTGIANTALGFRSLTSDATGMDNTAVGAGALANSASGSSNIAIGFNAGVNLTSGESNNVYLGNQGSAGESGVIRIGTFGQQFAAFVAGISGATSSSGTQVFVNTSGQLGTSTSSLRYKTDVLDMGPTTDTLMKLRPVTFHYRPEVDDGTDLLQYGLIAEEVAQVSPGLVQYDREGRPLAVRYHFINAMLLNEVQDLHRKLAAEEDRAARQDDQLAALRSQITLLQRQLGPLVAQLSVIPRCQLDQRVEVEGAHGAP
jgi:hypothetical protein